ncbi:hypothetical protein [Sutterella sp.]|uniref:hypothetical protein n=1 Tax=Sutterella sp. TaxID=1981025 RepID=UPI0026E0D6E0|nr:hypothetical protein [Sutterella sp.]MDO5531352.1 hypothetical protein [Sutterella sp.]
MTAGPSGGEVLARTLAAEWRAHRGLWLAVIALAFAAALAAAGLDTERPFTGALALNLARAVLFLSILAAAALLLTASAVQRSAGQFPASERPAFLSSLRRRTCALALLPLAAALASLGVLFLSR